MMAMVGGLIFAVFAFFNQCLCPLPCSQRIIDLSGVVVQIGLALTWPIIRSSICDSNGGCYWGDGSWALFFAHIFYFAASVFSRCMRDPRYKRRQERKDQDEQERREQEEREKQQADGPAVSGEA